jgi:hypothetical protein
MYYERLQGLMQIQENEAPISEYVSAHPVSQLSRIAATRSKDYVPYSEQHLRLVNMGHAQKESQ